MKILFMILISICIFPGHTNAQTLKWEWLIESAFQIDGDPIFANNDSFLFVGSNRGVTRTSDKGETWSEAIPIQDMSKGFIQITSMVVHNNLLIVTTGKGKVYHSVDNGVTWTKVGDGLPLCYLYTLQSIGSMLFATTDCLGVLRSKDNGVTWLPANSGMTDTSIHSIGARGNTIIAGGDLNMYRSIDNGDTWVRIKLNGKFKFLTGTGIVSNSNYFFVTTLQNSVIRSSDDGITWEDINSGLDDQYYNITANESRILISNFTNIELSVNNGETWTNENIGIPVLVSDITIIGNTMFAGTGTAIFRSEIVSGIDENTNSSTITISPNPSSTKLRILGMEGVSVLRMVNSLGIEVLSQQVYEGKVVIDVSDLANGVYFVQFRSQTGVTSKPIVVIR